MENIITGFDIFWSVIVFFFLYGYFNKIKSDRISREPYYKFYVKGWLAKVSGGISFCLIYVFYYEGGDTLNYYQGVDAMFEVLKMDPIGYFEIFFHDADEFVSGMFWKAGKYPPGYMLNDPRTFAVIKVSSFFSIFGLGGFLATTILVASFIYTWVWKVYGFVSLRYPHLQREINISFLFLPSTVFWGSGIMKDTFSFGAACFAVYGLQQFFIEGKRILKTVLQLIFAFYLILTIKSYIMFALLPGLLIFANFERLKKIKSIFIKMIILPVSIGLIFVIANTLFFDFSDLFGKYSADKLLEEAAVQNADLQRDVYGSNSFSIGEFEPTPQGALSKFFPAVNAAIFRPYVWETGSPTMLLSGIENIFLLIVSIYLIITKPFRFLRNIFSDPFLLFCLLFTLILGFGVGLSTSNFGALVRYKIPFLPFFIFLVLFSLKKKTD